MEGNETNGITYEPVPKVVKEMNATELQEAFRRETGFKYEGIENGGGKLSVRVSLYGKSYLIPTGFPTNRDAALLYALGFIQNNVDGLAELCLMDQYEEKRD